MFKLVHYNQTASCSGLYFFGTRVASFRIQCFCTARTALSYSQAWRALAITLGVRYIGKWICAPIIPYVFITLCFLNTRDSFTFWFSSYLLVPNLKHGCLSTLLVLCCLVYVKLMSCCDSPTCELLEISEIFIVSECVINLERQQYLIIDRWRRLDISGTGKVKMKLKNIYVTIF